MGVVTIVRHELASKVTDLTSPVCAAWLLRTLWSLVFGEL
jgi:hypothetical protein